MDDVGDYELMGVLAREGEVDERAHYVSFVKHAGVWILFDDEVRRFPTGDDELLGPNVPTFTRAGHDDAPYILMYHRHAQQASKTWKHFQKHVDPVMSSDQSLRRSVALCAAMDATAEPSRADEVSG